MSFDTFSNSDDSSNIASLKVPPHSVDAEQAVLGGLMLDNTVWDDIVDVLAAEDFYRAEHQLIFQAMMRQSEANSPIDALTLVESLNNLNELETAGRNTWVSLQATPVAPPISRPTLISFVNAPSCGV